MKDYILKPGTYVSKSNLEKIADIPGLSLEKYIIDVLKGETCCVKPIVLTAGTLLVDNALSTSPQIVKDRYLNSSALQLTTNKVIVSSTEQCSLEVKSSITGGGIALLDNTTTNNTQVGIGAIGNNLCFRAGGDPDGNMRLHSTGNLTIGGDLSDNGKTLDVRGTANITERVTIEADSTAPTQTTAVIQATTTNSGIAIVPNGTGAITAQVPDGTSVGGNARGQYAVDLQMSRTDANQVASGNYSVAIGKNNRSAGTNSVTIGDSNTVTGLGIGIGYSNIVNAADKPSAAIGHFNTVGEYSYAFGYDCTASSEGSVALGNFAKSTGGITLAFGYDSQASGSESISLGRRNKAQSQRSTALGGESNTASTGTHATVVGGLSNTSSGQYSITGGNSNTASGLRSVAFGGNNNNISGSHSFGTGQSNSIGGSHSFVAGDSNNLGNNNFSVSLGRSNTNNSAYTISLGFQSNVYLQGGISNANGRFSITGDSQQTLLTARKEDTLSSGATTILSLDGTGTTNLIIPNGNNRAWNVTVEYVAVCTVQGSGTTVVGDVVTGTDKFRFKRVGGTSTIGAVTNIELTRDATMTASNCTYAVGGSQDLQITFVAPTTANATTFRVVAKVSLVEVAW